MSFLDGALSGRGKRQRDALGEVHKLVDWTLRTGLDGLIGRRRGAGLSAADDVQVLLLQRWYGLSDRDGSGAVRPAELSAFCGLSAEMRRRTTRRSWRFREAVSKAGLSEPLFASCRPAEPAGWW